MTDTNKMYQPVDNSVLSLRTCFIMKLKILKFFPPVSKKINSYEMTLIPVEKEEKMVNLKKVIWKRKCVSMF